MTASTSPKHQRPSEFHSVQVVDTGHVNTYTFTVPRRYTNLQFINAGAQGAVVSADDLLDKRRVAIKKMHRPFSGLMSARRAYREIVLLSAVKHPNIIQTFSVFTPQQSIEHFEDVYIVMELMAHNLHDIITKHVALDHTKLSFFIYQLLCAVNHLHRAGIIHRDLKPSNVVINERCEIKVLDFGLARLMSPIAGERMSTYVTTRFYRAPEIVLGIPYSEKVDVWSIGSISAELINRAVLFPGLERTQQWNAITNVRGTPSEKFISQLGEHAAKYLRSLPKIAPKPMEQVLPDSNFLAYTEYPQFHMTAKDARRLISKMLEIDPDDRYSVDEALQDPYVKKWFRKEDVDVPITDSCYNPEVDVAEKSLPELKSLTFNEVKRLESQVQKEI